MDPPQEVNLPYYCKNKLIPQDDAFRMSLIEQTESDIKRMRWKVFFLWRGEDDSSEDEAHAEPGR